MVVVHRLSIVSHSIAISGQIEENVCVLSSLSIPECGMSDNTAQRTQLSALLMQASHGSASVDVIHGRPAPLEFHIEPGRSGFCSHLIPARSPLHPHSDSMIAISGK